MKQLRSFFSRFNRRFYLLALPLTLSPYFSWSKVVPPQSAFEFQQLTDFYPGKPVQKIENEYQNEEIVLNSGQKILKVQILHQQYRFPIYLQIRKGLILDFYAVLPTYFLHDVFHQSIINRFGPQQKYVLINETALYKWENEDYLQVYSATCTITCFPLFYTATAADSTHKTLYQIIQEGSLHLLRIP